MTELPQRSAIPEDETWNKKSVYASPDAWQRDRRVALQHVDKLSAFRGKLGQSPETLLDFLLYYNSVGSDVGKLRVYAVMDYSVDMSDETASERYSQLIDLYSRLNEASAFVEPELLELSPATLSKWLEQPSLSEYRHFFDNLNRQRPHVRSAEVEELLGGVTGVFAGVPQASQALANSELNFDKALSSASEPRAIGQSSIRALLADPDRTLRKNAYEAYADAHLQVQTTLGTLLATGVKQTVFLSKARRYASPLQMALDAQNLPLDVFYNLIDTFKNHLPTWHRYWRAKRRALNIETLRPFDIHAPLAEQPEIGFEQSCQWLKEALQPLGDVYVTPMLRGLLEERWVDRAINKGKRMGAFSQRGYGTHPFIMMSYTPDLLGMSTLAHEIGHSMHSYFTERSQPYVYQQYGMFAAEIASNFNQAMLRDYLFKQDKGFKFELALIDEAMANFYRYLFVMPTLARFELEIHERAERGEAISAKAFSGLLLELFEEGYGAELQVDEKRVGITWAQFHNHLYARFYVFQYATGISGAHALARGIIAGDDGAAARYLEFLRAGSSKYPLNALKDAGADLSQPKVMEETFGVLEQLVSRLEVLNQNT